MNIDWHNIRAVLFDSGDTLNRPSTGNWFITPNFYKILNRRVEPAKIKKALKKAYGILNGCRSSITEQEEYELFYKFYNKALNGECNLGVDKETVGKIASDCVFNDEKFKFYNDAKECLKKFKQKYTLGVVSDTWPSLERVFINKGFRNFFDIFIMSSVYGVTKQDRGLFEVAVEKLHINPRQIVFIDDSYGNLVVAKETGMVPILINRHTGIKSLFFCAMSKLIFYFKTGCVLPQIKNLRGLAGKVIADDKN